MCQKHSSRKNLPKKNLDPKKSWVKKYLQKMAQIQNNLGSKNICKKGRWNNLSRDFEIEVNIELLDIGLQYLLLSWRGSLEC